MHALLAAVCITGTSDCWPAGAMGLAATLSLIEAVAIALVIVADPGEFGARERHLTWWGVAGLVVFDCARAAGHAEGVLVTVGALQLVIIAGVWAMSIGKCDLLQDTFDDVGANVYFAGNFFLHYYPAARVLAYAPTRRIPNPAGQAVRAAGVVALYTATQNPERIYGCGAWAGQPVPLLSFWAVIAAAGAGSYFTQ